MLRMQSSGAVLVVVFVCLQLVSPVLSFVAPSSFLALRSSHKHVAPQYKSLRVANTLRMSGEEPAVDAPAPSSAITASKKREGPATLTDETEWKLVCKFTGPMQDGSFGPSVEVACKVIFSEDEGYEPPQGPIKVVNSNYLGSDMSFWKLDEDPEAEGFDKAGFWIWGLFEEPKYPFILLQMEVTQDIQTADGVVPKGTVYGQGKVTRDKETGVTLTEGVLTLREPVRMKVDLLGLSEGILAEIKPVGTFTVTAL